MSRFAVNALPRHLRLPRDRFLHIRRPPVLCLRAEQGTLWVTVDGQPEDISIHAGQGRVFDGRAPLTVGAVGGDAVLSAVALARRPGPLQRWWQRVLGGHGAFTATLGVR